MMSSHAVMRVLNAHLQSGRQDVINQLIRDNALIPIALCQDILHCLHPALKNEQPPFVWD